MEALEERMPLDEEDRTALAANKYVGGRQARRDIDQRAAQAREVG